MSENTKAITAGFHRDGLPTLSLFNVHTGSSALVFNQGAHLASWKGKDDAERIFTSSKSHYSIGKPIRGGIPICWPQFAGLGPLKAHGYARDSNWTLEKEDALSHDVSVVLRLDQTEETRLHSNGIELRYTVTLTHDDALVVSLDVYNSNEVTSEGFGFTTALHTYFQVGDVMHTQIEGVDGLVFEDKTRGGAKGVHTGHLSMDKYTDMILFGAPCSIRIVDTANNRAFLLEKSATLPDLVCWNPHAELAKKMADLGDDDYITMVCAEAAAVGEKVVLAGKQRWIGSQRIMVAAL